MMQFIMYNSNSSSFPVFIKVSPLNLPPVNNQESTNKPRQLNQYCWAIMFPSPGSMAEKDTISNCNIKWSDAIFNRTFSQNNRKGPACISVQDANRQAVCQPVTLSKQPVVRKVLTESFHFTVSFSFLIRNITNACKRKPQANYLEDVS